MEDNKNQLNVSLAIIVAGVIIAGAIMLKKPAAAPAPSNDENKTAEGQIEPMSPNDHFLGNPNAEVVIIEYADYQCPFCGKFFLETVKQIKKDYVDTGKIAYVYRDFAFLGEESQKSAEATECANDQGKYWDYHNYLFAHQDGENQGAFADKNLKAFAKTLGLNTTQFDSCLDSGKYMQKIKSSSAKANSSGVNTTPYSFILKNGKVVSEVKGAYPLSQVVQKLDAALK